MMTLSAAAPITADLSIGRACCRSATGLGLLFAARPMLQSGELVRDFGLSREEVRKALDGCGYRN